MAEVLLFFLVVSVILYGLFGGADFGAGILELFKGKHHNDEQEELITNALGPVWEANHMWLILAVVILFNGFPKAYAQISITFHIPLTLMLIGIICRGCAFTFRHYDTAGHNLKELYSRFFSMSSLITPFMLGTIAGGLMRGVDTSSGLFWDLYVDPWFNPFSIAVGFFVVGLFAYTASVLLLVEAEDPELKQIFKKRVSYSLTLTFFLGALVFASSYLGDVNFTREFFSEPLSISAFLLASALLFPLWKALHTRRRKIVRLLMGIQVTLISGAWLQIQFPVFLSIKNHSTIENIDFYNSVAPESTQFYLVCALVFGSTLIFPALFKLFSVFKRDRKSGNILL